MSAIKFFYTCPNCGGEQEVSVIPEEQPIIGGPPEACDPGSPAEVESGGICDTCGQVFDEWVLAEKADAIYIDRAEAAQESRAQDIIDRQRERECHE